MSITGIPQAPQRPVDPSISGSNQQASSSSTSQTTTSATSTTTSSDSSSSSTTSAFASNDADTVTLSNLGGFGGPNAMGGFGGANALGGMQGGPGGAPGGQAPTGDKSGSQLPQLPSGGVSA
ncbi:hypothetical protein [Telmatospirillum siberiense]|uniref:hypothetical protein n=1 Tax=Telmatospirillum siberiense TaxID=382514 RepID=UPI0011AF6210|nr:hypothetical protein [Telmatospirillum siberiense]